MNQKYPDCDSYQTLYARYLDGRGVEAILGLLEPIKDSRCLDLCGGEGRLTREALERGAAYVTYVDRERDMAGEWIREENSRLRPMFLDVKCALRKFISDDERFGRIACQQAINYWLDVEAARLLAEVLSPGAIFVFNTFNEEPSVVPRVLSYERSGVAFAEVSWRVGDVVHHVQVRQGMEPHVTEFEWLPRVKIWRLLEPYFILSEMKRGKTSYYKCVRNGISV